MLINDILERLRGGWQPIEQREAERPVEEREASFDRKRRQVCYHESAHALAALALGLEVETLYVQHDNSGYCQARNPTGGPIEDWPNLIFMIAGHVADECFFCKTRDPKSADATNVAELSSLVDRRNPERAKALAEDAAYEILARNRDAVGALAECLDDFGALNPADIEQVLSHFLITRCSVPDPTARPAAPPSIDRAPAEVELHYRVDGRIGGASTSAVRASTDQIRSRKERQALYDKAARNMAGAWEQR